MWRAHGIRAVRSFHTALRQTRATQSGQTAADVSKLVEAAARRADAQSAKRRRGGWLTRHRDILAVSVASVVAVSALKRRREFDEKLALSAALAERLEAERDAAHAELTAVEHRLLHLAPDVLADIDARKGWVSTANDARVEVLRGYIRKEFQGASAHDEVASADTTAGQAPGTSPRMV